MVRQQQSAIVMMTLLTGKWFVLIPIMYLLKNRTTGGLTVLFCAIYRSSCYYIGFIFIIIIIKLTKISNLGN